MKPFFPILLFSLRRPVTRTSLRSSQRGAPGNVHGGLVDPLLTKQKSLPDVSGISLFAYSMGRAGFIKPPDMTGSFVCLIVCFLFFRLFVCFLFVFKFLILSSFSYDNDMLYLMYKTYKM